jgi:hypothetical protein
MSDLAFFALLCGGIFACGWRAHGAWVNHRKAVQRRQIGQLLKNR